MKLLLSKVIIFVDIEIKKGGEICYYMLIIIYFLSKLVTVTL